jgi:hypothetical protein
MKRPGRMMLTTALLPAVIALTPGPAYAATAHFSNSIYSNYSVPVRTSSGTVYGLNIGHGGYGECIFAYNGRTTKWRWDAGSTWYTVVPGNWSCFRDGFGIIVITI